MKKKIFGILLLMLLIVTTVSASNTGLKKDTHLVAFVDGVSKPVPLCFNWGVDQKQTWDDGYGLQLVPPKAFAQSFTPSKDILTAVSMELFRAGAPPEQVEITVSIRDDITGKDLITVTMDTSVDSIDRKGRWVLFDFNDILVIPGRTYYLVITANAGQKGHSYCWLFSSVDDLYSNGDAWMKENEETNWSAWISNAYYPKDFCFKTYFKQPRANSILEITENLVNPSFRSIIRRSPSMVPLLRHLMGY